MASNSDIAGRVLDAALALAAEQRWQTLSLGEIAAAAGGRLSEMYDTCPSKLSLVRAFMRRVDAEVLANDFGFEEEDRPRDRLFDVLMARFDALNQHRSAVLSIAGAYRPGSVEGMRLLPDLARSMAWMLEAAGLSAEGPVGMLRTKGLVALWIAMARVWRDDDSPDMAPTMAALDRRLRRWESLTGAVANVFPRGLCGAGDSGRGKESGRAAVPATEPDQGPAPAL